MKIKCAAIINRDGVIYEGPNHGVILQSRKWEKRVNQPMFGFVTDTGIFVGRELASMIAFEAGQIPEQLRELRSEHLNYPEEFWPDWKKEGK